MASKPALPSAPPPPLPGQGDDKSENKDVDEVPQEEMTEGVQHAVAEDTPQNQPEQEQLEEPAVAEPVKRPEGVQKAGYLMGLSDSTNTWKRRYFVLWANADHTSGELRYYMQAPETPTTAPLSFLKIDGFTVCEALEGEREGRSFCLAVNVEELDFIFAAADEEERDSWINAFKLGFSVTGTKPVHGSLSGRSGFLDEEDPLADATSDFASELPECVPMVVKKTEESFQATKEAAEFYKKRVQLEREYGRGLSELYKNTTTMTLKKKLSGDTTLADKEVGRRTRKGWCALEESTNQAALGRQEFANRLQSEVVDPLVAFIRDKEPLRRKLVVDGLRRARELQETRANLVKLRDNLEKAEQAETQSKSSNFKERMAATFAKKSASALQELENEIQQAQTAAGEARLRYNAEVPGILRELQKLEEARLVIMRDQMRIFLDLEVETYMGFQEQWPAASAAVGEVDIHADVRDFIASCQAEYAVEAGEGVAPAQAGGTRGSADAPEEGGAAPAAAASPRKGSDAE